MIYFTVKEVVHIDLSKKAYMRHIYHHHHISYTSYHHTILTRWVLVSFSDFFLIPVFLPFFVDPNSLASDQDQ